MCGITAVLLTNGRSEALAEATCRDMLVSMTRALIHRGPDGEGYFFGARAALGHRRLAILDIDGGKQPMASADGRIQVSFNGEIYNHKDLRSELSARGHVFTTRSDTEVLVHGYREWGDSLPKRLAGMFAFVVHDQGSGRSLLARDPLGKKPLYYASAVSGDLLLMASEIRSFLVLPGFPRRIDPKALAELLALRYVPGDASLLENVRQVPAGHYALHEAGGDLRFHRYWQAPFGQVRETKRSLAEDAERLGEEIKDAVGKRLEADVPLGAFLSGGVDSAVVVAAMLARTQAKVRTVTVGFEDAAFDERPYARELAASFGTEHSEELLLPDPVSGLERLTEILDHPMHDASVWPSDLLCKAARRHVKVALSGDGGDESFGGYRRYRFDILENHWRPFMPRPLAAMLAGIFPKGDWLPRPLRLRRTLQNLSLDPAEAYFRSVSALLPEEVAAILKPGVSDRSDPFASLRALYDSSQAKDHMGRILDMDIQSYLKNDILVKMDRCSMANSLELRSPLLDPKIVEFAACLPTSRKLNARRGKIVLKLACAGWLPKEVLARPKQGFSIPLRSWLSGPLKEAREAAINGAFAAEYFDKKTLLRYARQHDVGMRDRSEVLWAVLILHRWYERWGRQT